MTRFLAVERKKIDRSPSTTISSNNDVLRMHNLQNEGDFFGVFSGERGQARGEHGVRVASRLPPPACKTRKNNARSEQVLSCWFISCRVASTGVHTVLCVARGWAKIGTRAKKKNRPNIQFLHEYSLRQFVREARAIVWILLENHLTKSMPTLIPGK